MTRCTRRLVLLALAGWGACLLGPCLRRFDAFLAALAVVQLLWLSVFLPRARWLPCAALFMAWLGLSAEAVTRPIMAPPSTPLMGRVEEMIDGTDGLQISVIVAGGRRVLLHIPRSGEGWLDRLDPAVCPGATISAELRPGCLERRNLRALSASCVRVTRPPSWWHSILAYPALLRGVFVARARERFRRGASQRVGGLLLAMVAGEKQALHPVLRDQLRASGLAHIAVVSGMHVGLLVAMLPLLISAHLGRKHRGLALTAALAASLSAALLPSTPPIRRAFLAFVLAQGARLAGRANNAVAALAGAIVLLLAVDPVLARCWSFALTVSASLALVVASGDRPRAPRALIFVVPVLATWPLIIAMGSRLAPWAFVANLAVLPAIPVSLIAGWAQVLLPGGESLLGAIAGFFARNAAGWIAAVAAECSRWPGSGRLAAPVGTCWFLAHAALLVALIWKGGRRRGFVSLALAFSWAWPMLPVAWPPLAPAGAYLLDVGQGQGVLLIESGRAVLMDAADNRDPRGTRALLAALRRYGVRRLEGLVISHADRDHSGGASAVLSALAPRWLALPAAAMDGAALRALEAEASRRAIPLRPMVAGQSLFPGHVLYPPPGARCAGNRSSIVLFAQVGGVSVLIPGDVDRESEDRFGSHPVARSRLDLLVAGHHGSRFSTGEPLLARFRPRIVGFSCGRANAHGHPHPATLARVRRAGSRMWSTARSGGLALRRRGSVLILEALE